MAPDEFIATYLEPLDDEPLEPHLIERDLALHMGQSIVFNRGQMRRLTVAFRVGAVLLVGEVLAWIFTLIASG